jgi:two-component system CheB/CheR fusion protein
MQDWHILVVEDDPDGQEVVATILEHAKMHIAVANDAEQAEQLLFGGGYQFDAVVIDLALPGKNGWELLDEILNTPQTSALKCIAVTAYHSSKLREEALSAGFYAYFPKPIEATVFVRELTHILAED